MRRRARLKEAQNWGELPTSVVGGERKAGSASARPASCGPGIARALGSVTLAAPSGGRSGLPNEAACASVAVIAAAPAAVAQPSCCARTRRQTHRQALGEAAKA